MKFCQNCGEKITEGQKFCAGCGQKITAGNELHNSENHTQTFVNENIIHNIEVNALPDSQKKTENKFPHKWIFILGGVIIALVLLLSLVRCSKSVFGNAKLQDNGIGDTVVYNDVSITLESVEKYDTTFMPNQTEQGTEYILLWFTVDNAGDEDFSFTSFVYDRSQCDGENVANSGILPFSVGSKLGEEIMTTIKAGEKKYGYAMYNVKTGWNEFEFIYDPNALDFGTMQEDFSLVKKENNEIIFKFNSSEVAEATTQFSNSKYGLRSLDDVKNIYKFTLDGTEYALPFRASELIASGWAIRGEDPQTDTLDAATYSNYVLYKGEQSIDVAIANATGEPAILNDCMIMEVNITEESGVSFETADGFAIGSSYQAVYEKYGEGDYEGSIASRQLHYEFLKDLLSDGRLTSIGSTNNFSDNMTVRWNEEGNISSIRMNLVLFN